MFNNNRLAQPDTEPTPEPTQGQIDVALSRVVLLDDGSQTLDGYLLPPDNNEVFNPRTLTMHNIGTGVKTEFETTIPNSLIRQANIEQAALGRGPLFIKPDDPEHLRKMQEWQDKSRTNRGPVSKLIDKLLY